MDISFGIARRDASQPERPAERWTVATINPQSDSMLAVPAKIEEEIEEFLASQKEANEEESLNRARKSYEKNESNIMKNFSESLTKAQKEAAHCRAEKSSSKNETTIYENFNTALYRSDLCTQSASGGS
ncbi:hypothetical protein T4B_13653 [Trichinella pseudospiralis]|uniref:Uncharacterized protein n=1 Tax=Trichinella pseudospiralis TaxID=6337 RepID=A0A0V1HPM5_TRIPS|nr:hypothetical protein T4B_13653 [Trichinella pseudospiralis]